nr:putative malate dehydrogenase 1B [Neodiprion pinetum]
MTDNQPLILVAGVMEDQVFSHVCYVASHLSQTLPNFRFERICKQCEEWEPWLEKICKTRGWSHENSPLVWRKFGKSADNYAYIGDATQFWEFIREYYGIESQLSKDELNTLGQDCSQEAEIRARKNTLIAGNSKLRVSIFGSDRQLCENLAIDLCAIEILHLAKEIVVKLYNPPVPSTRLKDEIREIETPCKSSPAIKIVQSLSIALADCDILIILNEIPMESGEAIDYWLNRNGSSMLDLARQINDFAPDCMKVVFCSAGPNCLNAGLLASTVTNLDANNIVVVSSHLGFEILCETANLVDVALEEMGCPPVWGFIGINHFVDMHNTIQRHEIYRPNNRALKSRNGTTLPLGARHQELSSIFYMVHDKDPDVTLLEHKVSLAGDSQKCIAICDLLRLWYNKNNNVEDEIISLGICSDGTFGIPKGIFFSQPVYLQQLEDDSRRWLPCAEFPQPGHQNWILNNMIETAQILAEKIMFGTYTIRGRDLILDVVDESLKVGFRSIDTAARYGNEGDIGEALRISLPKYNLKREDIFVTTKLAPSDTGCPEKVYNAVKNSLSKLGLTYLDLYLIHWPGAGAIPENSTENIKLRDTTWKVLADFQKQGILRSIGVSNYLVKHLKELLANDYGVRPAVNQVECHPHYRQDELRTYCNKEGIHVQAYSSLGTSKSNELLQDPTVNSIATEYKVSPARVLLRWALQQGIGIIPKAAKMEHIRDNIDLNFVINDQHMKTLSSLPQKKYTWDPTNVC